MSIETKDDFDRLLEALCAELPISDEHMFSLIVAHGEGVRVAVADEREACHRIARTYNPLKHNRPAGIHQSGIAEAGAVNAAADIASAIAARGISKPTEAHPSDCECHECWREMER